MDHEVLLRLFANRISLAPEVLRDMLGFALPRHTSIRREAGDLSELVPVELRADLVLLLEDDRPVLAIVVEVQLGRDPRKRWVWPSYLTALRARFGCDAVLLVVTKKPSVARWASRPIPLGHPGFELRPLVLGPAMVPVVTDVEAARQSPELAVLAAMAHGRSLPTEEAVHLGEVAIEATRSLDDERARLYADLIVSAMGPAARRALEELLMSNKYEYQSDFAKKYYGQGLAEGKAEGEAAGKAEGEAVGKAEALLVLLAARGLVVTARARARILAERRPAQLDAWITRAATASSLDEVLDEPPS